MTLSLEHLSTNSNDDVARKAFGSALFAIWRNYGSSKQSQKNS
jgi:hypothetical protein